MNNQYYKNFNSAAYRRNGGFNIYTPPKEEYEAYIHPTKVDRKTGLVRMKEAREMTFKEITYHNYIMNYFYKHIQPYQNEV
jgi:hypothetical protein